MLVLHLVMTAISLRSFVLVATTPERTESDVANTSDTQKLSNLLAPPSYVLSMWLPLFFACFNFGVGLDHKSSFITRYSTPASRD